jgi:hypothetical protein
MAILTQYTQVCMCMCMCMYRHHHDVHGTLMQTLTRCEDIHSIKGMNILTACMVCMHAYVHVRVELHSFHHACHLSLLVHTYVRLEAGLTSLAHMPGRYTRWHRRPTGEDARPAGKVASPSGKSEHHLQARLCDSDMCVTQKHVSGWQEPPGRTLRVFLKTEGETDGQAGGHDTYVKLSIRNPWRCF